MSLHYAAVAGHVVAADVQLVASDPRPPVVFLHGVLTSVTIGGLLRAAVPDLSWIAISLPGHHPGGFVAYGQPGQLTSESFSAPVEALLDELVGDRQVVVVGWSLGGFSALALAAHYPRRVAGLAGLARGRIGGITDGMAALTGLPLVRLVLRTGLGLAAEWPWLHRGTAGLCTAAGRSAVIPAEVLRAMHADYARHDLAALAAVLAAISRLDVSVLLKNIAVPACIPRVCVGPVVFPGSVIPRKASLAMLAHVIAAARGIRVGEIRKPWRASSPSQGTNRTPIHIGQGSDQRRHM
jgi:pimeloyl-ACP methyl ester carboxylesterase